jgi:hypothetical protein
MIASATQQAAMTIWKMTKPRHSVYAEPGLRGAWREGYLCKECTRSTEKRIQPLIVEWEPGSDKVGDFSWASTGCAVITERVHQLLSERFRGYEPGSVEMLQHPKLKRPQRTTKRTQARVWLPYQGSPLFELWLIARVHMDADLTTAKLVRECNKCGYRRWELEGYEHWEHKVEIRHLEGWAREYKDISVRHSRKAGKGLFVQLAGLEDRDIFEVAEFPGWVLCTNRVKQCAEEQAFTNVEFMEMGELI